LTRSSVCMPTPVGAETIGERLTRLRAELTRVRLTIERHESNAQSFSMGGVSVTEIAYERALVRERQLESDILDLERRLTGSKANPHIAQTVTVTE